MSALFCWLVASALAGLLASDVRAQVPFDYHFVRTGQDPASAIYDRFHQRFFVTVPANNQVIVVAEGDGSIVSTISLTSPFEMDLSPDGTRLYVTSLDADGFFVVDTTSLQMIDFIQPAQPQQPDQLWSPNQVTIPRFIAAMRNGKIFYYAAQKDTSDAQIFAYDPSTGVSTPRLPPGVFAIDGLIRKSADGSRLVFSMAANSDGNLWVYDSDSDAYTANVAAGSYHYSASVSPDGTRILIDNHLLFDQNLQQIADLQWPSGSYATARSWTPAFSPDGSKVYAPVLCGVTCGNGPFPLLAVFDASSGAPLGFVPAPTVGYYGSTDSFVVQRFAVGAQGRAILPSGFGFVEFNVSRPLSALGTLQSSPVGAGVGSLTNPGPTVVNPGVAVGTDALAGARVFFGAAPALSVSPTCPNPPWCQLTVQPPPAPKPGPVDVTVGFADGSAAFGPEAYSYGPFDLYWDVNAGDSNGGTSVNLFGYGLSGADGQAQVTVGGTSAAVTSQQVYSYSGFTSPTGQLTFTTPSGQAGPADITVTTPDGSTTRKNGFRYVSRRTIPGLQPAQMLLDEPRGRLYAADAATGNVQSVDLRTLTVTTLLSTPNTPASLLAMTPDGSKLLVASTPGQTLTVFDLNAGVTLRSFFPVPGNQLTNLTPNAIAATSRGTALVGLWDYVAVYAGAVYEVDLQTGNATPVADMPTNQWRMLLAGSTDGSMVYIAPESLQPDGNTQDAGDLHVWNAAANAVTYRRHYYGDIFQLSTTASGDRVLTDFTTYSSGLSAVATTTPDDLFNLFPLLATRVFGQKLHYSGSLQYTPTTLGVEIYDAHQGTMLLSVAVPGGVANTADGLVVDHSGAVLYVAETDGVGVYNLGRAPLSIGTVVPARGNASGGDTVTLLGTGFQQGAVVTIDGQTVPANLVDTTRLTFVVPAISARKVVIAVANPDGGSYTLPLGYDASPSVPAPVVSGLLSAYGGCQTVNGSGFAAGAQVLLDGVPLQTFSVSPQQLGICIYAVDGVPGFGQATITVSNGSAAAVSKPLYLPPPDPPYLNSPGNGATGVPLTAQLSYWGDSDYATAYDLYFGTSSPPPFLGTGAKPGPLSPNTTYYWRVVARNVAGATSSPTFSFTTSGPAVGLAFVPVTPCRVADTRYPAGPFGGPVMAGGFARSFAIQQSACGIPGTAQAYSLNVTVVPQGRLSYLTLWPTGLPQPLVSTLNSWGGDVVANAAIVPAGTDGAISVFVTDTTDVILDINGYFEPIDSIWDPPNPADSFFYALNPCRVVDTRNPAGPFGGPSMTADQSRDFPVLASSCQILQTTAPYQLQPSARAYSMNVTVVPDGPLAFLTTWPSGQLQPNVSTLNSWKGKVTANAAIVPAGSGGSVSVFATDPTNLILDINGYFGPAVPGSPVPLRFFAVTPCRVADTRNPDGPFGGPIMEAGTTREFAALNSSCYVPPGTQAYSLNITVVPDGPLWYLGAWQWQGGQPNVSVLNSWDGAVVANAAIVPANDFGIAVYVTNRTHVILDINGYFAP